MASEQPAPRPPRVFTVPETVLLLGLPVVALIGGYFHIIPSEVVAVCLTSPISYITGMWRPSPRQALEQYYSDSFAPRTRPVAEPTQRFRRADPVAVPRARPDTAKSKRSDDDDEPKR